MSILDHANNTLVQGPLYAVAGDQHNYYGGSVASGGKTAIPQGFDMLYQHYSTDALFDSIAHSDQPKCLEGTRVAIIKDVLARVRGKEKSGSICWLKGPAGAGKSALEYTIAAICKKKGLLIGGFAFSRTAANRGDGNTLIPTLAIQLSRVVPAAKFLIDDALKENQDIFRRSREAQLQLLVVEPLQQLWDQTGLRDSFRRGWRYPTVIAIDGLDECSDRDVQRDIITSIGAVVRGIDFPLSFFIASRPEAHISQTFQKLQSDKRVRLSSICLGEDAAATRDIQTYLETRFQEIRELHPHLPETWPSSSVITQLVENASGQFIYVSTIMTYIASVSARPDACLQVILRLSTPSAGDNPFAQLDLLYSHILCSVEDQAATLQILGCLILPKKYYYHGLMGANKIHIREFKSPIVLETLFGLERGDVRRLMIDLLSVVAVGNDDQPMKVLHASLGDFLLDKSRSKEHFIDPNELCATLARKSIDHIASFKAAIFDFNNVELFITPSVSLCVVSRLSKELHDVLRDMDMPSAQRSLVYSSPMLFNTIYKTFMDLNHCLDFKVPIEDTSIWSTYMCEFQQPHGISPKGIFITLTGQWQMIRSIVRDLSADSIILPYLPVIGQVVFRSPRADDPVIILVLVPSRPNVPVFVAKVLDKKLVKSKYGIGSNHVVFRYQANEVFHEQEASWFFLWSNLKIAQ